MARQKPIKVLALCQPECVPPKDATDTSAKHALWKMEHQVLSTLRALGHAVKLLPIEGDLRPIRAACEQWRPDLTLNLLEAFDGEVLFDQNVVSYLELLHMPYTGCSPRGLILSRDKALSKKVATWHRVKVPNFFVLRRGDRVRKPARLSYPLIVKSLIDDASLGLSQASVVSSDHALEERVGFMHAHWDLDLIIEQFIPGRELYVGVIGNRRLTLFPPWELRFDKRLPNSRLLATRRVKWDKATQDRLGVDTGPAAALPATVARSLPKICRRLARGLMLEGYARLDFRLSEEGTLYFLEANANPDLSRDEDLALSAAAAGLDYPRLLQKILSLGLRR